MSVATHFKKLT